MRHIKAAQFYLNENVRFRQEEFGGIVFKKKTRDIHELNKMGFFILSLISKGLSMNEITDKLVKKYSETPKSEITNSIDSFILELLDLEIIKFVN